jgi:hypothetical protein
MGVLLDVCVPRGLRNSLSGHEVRTAPEMGWGKADLRRKNPRKTEDATNSRQEKLLRACFGPRDGCGLYPRLLEAQRKQRRNAAVAPGGLW